MNVLRPFKHAGRVGDSPLVGSGLYADSRVGGAVATGDGEDIMRSCLRCVCVYTYIYTYIYICVCVCVYIYEDIMRSCLRYVCVCVNIYVSFE